ncbi:MAG: hypothetical protein Q8922_07625 [Bacteroidota bacterium]|nr:hypothetical protein [Bacteroidota bacterium]MDP4233238.1 hypothetical protein [Bacteroidota bacterium]MDP4242143.1 hypothetical protein [Bacteroidota bacterium]MDP4287792.1 hypothetical protein [Bacteroidota bacterium]
MHTQFLLIKLRPKGVIVQAINPLTGHPVTDSMLTGQCDTTTESDLTQVQVPPTMIIEV